MALIIGTNINKTHSIFDKAELFSPDRSRNTPIIESITAIKPGSPLIPAAATGDSINMWRITINTYRKREIKISFLPDFIF